MKKNNKPAAKRYMKTVGMVMASVMVLSSTTGQMVYAESAKDQKDTQDGEKKEEKTIVYLNGKTGNDKNSGESQDEAVKSFEKAAELAGSSGVIRICGTVTVDEEETWELPSGVSIRRAEDFEDALVRVTGCLKLESMEAISFSIGFLPRLFPFRTNSASSPAPYTSTFTGFPSHSSAKHQQSLTSYQCQSVPLKFSPKCFGCVV